MQDKDLLAWNSAHRYAVDHVGSRSINVMLVHALSSRVRVDEIAAAESTGEALGKPLDVEHVTDSGLESGVRVAHVHRVVRSGLP